MKQPHRDGWDVSQIQFYFHCSLTQLYVVMFNLFVKTILDSHCTVFFQGRGQAVRIMGLRHICPYISIMNYQ